MLAADEDSAFLRAPALALTERRAVLVGQRLHHYAVLEPVGAGAMGEVYLAQDLKLERRVALKVLPVAFTRDTDRLQRFIREAKATSALNHQNIITVFDIGREATEAGEIHFIATEFIEGVTLRQRLQRAGSLPLPEVLALAAQIAAALVAAHAAGVMHRDIKPENIMVRPDGVAKVLDFGLAKLAERRGDGAKTATRPVTPSPSLPVLPAKPAWCWARHVTCHPNRRCGARRWAFAIASTQTPRADWNSNTGALHCRTRRSPWPWTARRNQRNR